MRNNIDAYEPTGHLKIYKQWTHNHTVIPRLRGTRELVYDEANTIVSGMGVGLAFMLTGSGSNNITNYQIRYFQVGVNAPPTYDLTTYTLGSSLNSVTQYGSNIDSLVCSLPQLKNGIVTAGQIFVEIPFNLITRVAQTSVQYLLTLGVNACNGQTLNEIGLFMKNPLGLATVTPILVSYKTFSAIAKTNDFSLVFSWTITF